MDGAARWRALPAGARGPALGLVLQGASAGVGAMTPVGSGNAVFATGAALVLASIWFVRLGGGPREVVVARDVMGRPRERAPQPADERRAEIATGLRLFFTGLALWAALGLWHVLPK